MMYLWSVVNWVLDINLLNWCLVIFYNYIFDFTVHPAFCVCYFLDFFQSLTAAPGPDILEVDFLARAKLYFWQFWARKCASLKSPINGVKTSKKHGKIAKLHNFSSFVAHIFRFCANSAWTHVCITMPFRSFAWGTFVLPYVSDFSCPCLCTL